MSRARLLAGKRDRWTPWAIPLSVRRLWLSARDHGAALMTDDGAGLISSWSGRGNLGQTYSAAGSARPTYSATGMGGVYPAVSGDGVATAMTMASTTGLPTGSTPSVAMALASGTASGSTHVFAYGQNASTQIRRLSRSSAGITLVSNGNLSLSVARDPSTPVILVGSWATDLTENIRVDGGALTNTGAMSALATATTRSRLFAGVNTAADAFWNGPLSSLIVLSGSIATLLPTIQKIEGYWAWRYPLLGLAASFPADHPYKHGTP